MKKLLFALILISCNNKAKKQNPTPNKYRDYQKDTLHRKIEGMDRFIAYLQKMEDSLQKKYSSNNLNWEFKDSIIENVVTTITDTTVGTGTVAQRYYTCREKAFRLTKNLKTYLPKKVHCQHIVTKYHDKFNHLYRFDYIYTPSIDKNVLSSNYDPCD
jgi:PBP1b-binding outer membrane lipoprotein LpoB